MEECQPPNRLARWQYADYFEGQRERAFSRLLVSLKRRADSLGLKFERPESHEKPSEEKKSVSDNSLLETLFKKQVIVIENSLLKDLFNKRETFLDGKSHNIHFLKQVNNIDTDKKRYGWAKVSGDSMSAAKPIAILENDFILFYESYTADNNDIVIAAYSNNAGVNYQYLVKCYSKNAHLLISETEIPNRYPPMPITDEVTIIGVVIAVAKSKNNLQ